MAPSIWNIYLREIHSMCSTGWPWMHSLASSLLGLLAPLSQVPRLQARAVLGDFLSFVSWSISDEMKAIFPLDLLARPDIKMSANPLWLLCFLVYISSCCCPGKMLSCCGQGLVLSFMSFMNPCLWFLAEHCQESSVLSAPRINLGALSEKACASQFELLCLMSLVLAVIGLL